MRVVDECWVHTRKDTRDYLYQLMQTLLQINTKLILKYELPPRCEVQIIAGN
jgi:hypothetical protein